MTSRGGAHALVTGASSGIGAAVTARLLREGWRVTGLDRAPPRADFMANPAFAPITDDLLDTAGIPDALGTLEVTALVHAAGFMRGGTLGDLDAFAGDELWRVNIAAASMLANTLVPRMTAGGRVVLIGSRQATGVAGRSQYAAVKAALVALARSWAAEVVTKGITVNVVAPGATNTPMLVDPARRTPPPKPPPIGRLIQPEEVAASVCFLLSPESAPITGHQLVMCGGASL